MRILIWCAKEVKRKRANCGAKMLPSDIVVNTMPKASPCLAPKCSTKTNIQVLMVKPWPPPAMIPTDIYKSAAEFAKDRTYRNTVYRIRTGAGKSRVTVALARMLLQQMPAIPCIHIVFSSKMLERKDRDYYTDILSDPRVRLHSSANFDVNAGDFIIWDEGDEVLFNSPEAFVTRMRAAKANIVLTASAYDSKQGMEALIL